MKVIDNISEHAEYKKMSESKLGVMGELSESTRMHPYIKDKKSLLYFLRFEINIKRRSNTAFLHFLAWGQPALHL